MSEAKPSNQMGTSKQRQLARLNVYHRGQVSQYHRGQVLPAMRDLGPPRYGCPSKVVHQHLANKALYIHNTACE